MLEGSGSLVVRGDKSGKTFALSRQLGNHLSKRGGSSVKTNELGRASNAGGLGSGNAGKESLDACNDNLVVGNGAEFGQKV